VPRSKDEWSYTSTPQYAFMMWCSVKKRNRYKFIVALDVENMKKIKDKFVPLLK
jgi:hypothetical protein